MLKTSLIYVVKVTNKTKNSFFFNSRLIEKKDISFVRIYYILSYYSFYVQLCMNELIMRKSQSASINLRIIIFYLKNEYL